MPPRWTSLLLAIAFSQRIPPMPVDPMLDPEIWGFGGIGGSDPRSHPPLAEPIVPDHWLIIPAESGSDPATLLAKWMIAPDADPPVGVESADRIHVSSGCWLRRDSTDPGPAACAYTTVRASRAVVRMARLTGAPWMLVNGEPVSGDSERRCFRGVPVALHEGENRIFVAAGGAPFELELWEPISRLVIEPFDIGWLGDNTVTYPILNASTATAHFVHVHYGPAVRWMDSCKPCLTDWEDGGYIAPLSLMFGTSYYDGIISEACGRNFGHLARDAFIPICVYAEEGECSSRQLLRRQPDCGGRIFNNFETLSRPKGTWRNSLIELHPPGSVQIFGTQGTPAETEAELAAARFEQQLEWYRHAEAGVVISDVEYLAGVGRKEEDWINRHTDSRAVILRGNADTNAAWSRFVPGGAGIEARRGSVTLGSSRFIGDGLAGWARFALGPRIVFAQFDTGLEGARLQQVLTAGWWGGDKRTAIFQRDETEPGAWCEVPLASER